MAEQPRNQQKRQQAESRQAQQSQSGSDRQGGTSRQQQQFDATSRQQGGDGGADGRFADQIQPHQDVVDQSGAFVGTVDHVDGDRIKLTRSSSGDGEHQFIPLSQVAGIEGGKIRLQGRGDASFGQAGNSRV